MLSSVPSVLIESDWNLKTIPFDSMKDEEISINRIRLEFKVRLSHISDNLPDQVLIESDWNLKPPIFPLPQILIPVLIESDWNLKEVHSCYLRISGNGINRIRLEFKVPFYATK